MAGQLTDPVKFSSEGVSVTETEIFNNALFDQVEKQCNDDLYSQLRPKQIEALQKNTPKVVVTTTLPSRVKEIDSIVPKQQEVNGRRAFLYEHPENQNLCVRIFEPASPSDNQINIPNEEPLCCKLVKANASSEMQHWWKALVSGGLEFSF